LAADDCAFAILKSMEVHFTPELQEKLTRVAAENSRRPDDYVQQLVESYLDYDAWFRQKVTASLGRLDRGEFVSHDEVGARLEKSLQP
jgi:predicted transcriptional regulator